MEYNNFVASMISAIRQDWQPAVKSKKKSSYGENLHENYDWDKLEEELFAKSAVNY